MIMEYSEIDYNTNKECYEMEDVIIKTALEDGKYNDLLKACMDKGIKLQYDDIHRTKANLVKRVTGKTWSKVKKEIQARAEDYTGITPTREGYLFQDKVYEDLQDAHYTKLKKQHPKLARIIYE